MPSAAGSALASPAAALRLNRARAATDLVFAQVRREALYDRAIAERHRLIFYLGHLEAFDWNLIGSGALGLPPIDATLDPLFAFGIDPTNGDLPDDQPSDWPALAEVQRYGTRARSAMDDVLTRGARAGVDPDQVEVAIEQNYRYSSFVKHFCDDPINRVLLRGEFQRGEEHPRYFLGN